MSAKNVQQNIQDTETPAMISLQQHHMHIICNNTISAIFCPIGIKPSAQYLSQYWNNAVIAMYIKILVGQKIIYMYGVIPDAVNKLPRTYNTRVLYC